MFRKFIESTFNIVKDAVLRIDLDYSINSDTDTEEVLQIVTEQAQVHLQQMSEQPEGTAESQEVVHTIPDDEKCALEPEVVEKYPQGNEGSQGPSTSRSSRDLDEFRVSEGETACSLSANTATNSREENKSHQQSEQNMSLVIEESVDRPNQLPEQFSHSIDPIQTDPGCARHIAGNLMDDVQCDPGYNNPIPRHHLAAVDEQNEDEGIHLNEEHDHQDLHYRHQTPDETERSRRLKHDKQDDGSDTVLVIEISTGGKGLLADEPVQQNRIEANGNMQPPVAQDDEANNLEQLVDHPIVQPVDQEADQPVIQPDDHEAVWPVLQPNDQEEDQPVVQLAAQNLAQENDEANNLEQLLYQPRVRPVDQEADQPVIQPVDQEADQPVIQPDDQQAAWPVLQPDDQEAGQPIDYPSDQEEDQPVVQLADQDLAQDDGANNIQQLADQPIVRPVAVQPVIQPDDQGAEQPAVREEDQLVVQPADQGLAQAGPANPQDDNELPRADRPPLNNYVSFNGLDSSEADDDEDVN